MTQRTAPPFRADHVGSLLRPPELVDARAEFAAGRLDSAGLREVEDKAVREIVRLQEDVGLRSATDGEFRRGEWHSDFIYKIAGIRQGTGERSVVAHLKGGDEIEYTVSDFAIVGDVHLPETIFGEDFKVVASAATTATPKQTIPSPSMVHFRPDLSASPYTDVEEFRTKIAGIYAEELRGMFDLGCRYLQLDDTFFAFLNDPSWRAMTPADAKEPQHETNVRVINEALAGRPDELTVTVHMCRGNYRSAWFTEGGYDYVAEAVFGGLEVDGLFLEYDDERSGTFDPLRFVPDDKIVVLGLVTTKSPELESKDRLKRQVEEASRFVDVDRLCLSPQCGFASVAEGNALTHDQQRAKLELIVETAEEIWG